MGLDGEGIVWLVPVGLWCGAVLDEDLILGVAEGIESSACMAEGAEMRHKKRVSEHMYRRAWRAWREGHLFFLFVVPTSL